ncbi:MAG TPA: hypothetical protein PKV71_16765, partial [Calditrichia bacterium]|nr:hypothetical protein [Calditrichia bacterium]
PYIRSLEKEGMPPRDFVLKQLEKFDLLIFDDAWHPVVEPFDFYRELIALPAFHQRVKTIFLEAVSITEQPALDAYLAAEVEDPTLLFPAFQNDFSGLGWPFQTYFDLLKTVYQVNRSLPAAERLRVVAVNAPSFWEAIHSAEDVALFRKSLVGNDYFMYKTILAEMADFREGRKGIFLTNTRHAYKGIRDQEGRFFWNCGTFFHQWHPGKTSAIRFHHLSLIIESEAALSDSTARSTAGMERYRYRWERMAGGKWDGAFAALGNRPVAISLRDTPFGREPYVGNHMHKAAPGQTLFDAYDALIFLAPLESLHNTAETGALYTPAFRKELLRRLPLLFTAEQLQEKMRRSGAGNLPDYIDQTFSGTPQELIPQTRDLPPLTF